MKIIAANSNNNCINKNIVKLTEQQKKMLQLGEADIKYGRLILQDEMNKRNVEWLEEK